MKKLLTEDGTILNIQTAYSAAAVKYDRKVGIPFITAKGKNELAKKIVEEAEKNSIPIKEDEELVDLLTAEDVNSAVPEEAWNALAAIFAFILETKK